MSKDYYKTLGVDKGASQADIKKAFYKKAQEFHPDKPTGDEKKFKEVNEAYRVLSDEQKRAQYDQFGSDGMNFNGGSGGFDFSGFQGGGAHFDFGAGGIDLEDILRQFGMGGAGFGGSRVQRGRDVQMTLHLSFKEAILGAEKEIEVPKFDTEKPGDTKRVKVSIPSGVEHGQRIRMPGYGQPLQGGEPGHLYLLVTIDPHKTLRREGQHLVTHLEISLSDAINGCKREIETLDGPTTIKIPAGTQSGEILRVRGKGVPSSGGFFGSSTGDLLIPVTVTIPSIKKLSKKAKEAIEILEKEGL